MDFCGMKQNGSATVQWTRHSGPTPSNATGPPSAYSGSHYIYVEAGGVSSPALASIATGELNYEGPACVTFAYHMYGSDEMFLTVRNAASRRVVWEVLGDQGNHWRQATADVSLHRGDTLLLEARVKGYLAVIGVDKVLIRSGGCKMSVDLPFDCSFEDNFCNMAQSYHDQLDWTRYNHQTATNPTVPEKAADGQWFIYIETGATQTTHAAKIYTPTFNLNGSICVRFQYRAVLGMLTVLHEYDSSKSSLTLFNISRNKGPSWISSNLDVSDFSLGNWITFIGQSGAINQVDIALDNIVISAGQCSECLGNRGHCSHTCINTPGSYRCVCPSGMRLGEDLHTCKDVDECSTENQCDQQCHNNPGGYHCSCDDTHILATDDYHCIDCKAAYERKFDASQAFSSDCPTMRLLSDVTLESCLLEACNDNISVVAFVNAACDLKDCTGNDIQLATAAGKTGWDIYVQNVTWPQDFPVYRGTQGFPMWQLLVGVILGTVALVAVGVAVTLCLRKKRISTNSSNSIVLYESDTVYVTPDRQQPQDSREDEEQNTETAAYMEIPNHLYEQTVPEAGTGDEYQNAAFQGEGSYQALNRDM